MNAAAAPSVLIRLDNIRSGGGLQVAQSFLTELAKIIGDEAQDAYPWLRSDLGILISEEVAANCSRETLACVPATVVSRRRVSRSFTEPIRADVVFTLFGPTYDRVVARRAIAGFADVTSLYPQLAAGLTKTPAQRVKLRLRTALSRAFFRKADISRSDRHALASAVAAFLGVVRWSG